MKQIYLLSGHTRKLSPAQFLDVLAVHSKCVVTGASRCRPTCCFGTWGLGLGLVSWSVFARQWVCCTGRDRYGASWNRSTWCLGTWISCHQCPVLWLMLVLKWVHTWGRFGATYLLFVREVSHVCLWCVVANIWPTYAYLLFLHMGLGSCLQPDIIVCLGEVDMFSESCESWLTFFVTPLLLPTPTHSCSELQSATNIYFFKLLWSKCGAGKVDILAFISL